MKSILFVPLLIFVLHKSGFSQDKIVIDSSIKFQTIEGWGHGGGILGHIGGPIFYLDSAIANPVSYQILDYLIDDLGLTGSRTWEVGPRIDGTGMDNGDCDNIDWTKFQSNTLPQTQATFLVYFKNRITAKGFKPNFYSSPTYPTAATAFKPWVFNNPGERAQQIWANALYMKNTYGIDINYDVIFNEPSGSVTANLIAEDIKALGPRLIDHGLITRSQYAEGVTPQTTWNFITPVQNDSELWKYVGRLSYHIYGTTDPYRTYIQNFAQTLGITTAQTEMGNPTFDDLYSDLILGGVSYWEVAFSSNSTLVPNSGLTTFTPSSTYFRLRQVMHYVNPGDIRIATNTNDSLLHVLAFSKNGAITTIIENVSATTRSVLLSGLPSGKYGLSQAQSGTVTYQELGIRTVNTNDTITINVIGNSAVTTLYPYSGINQPPTIMIWKSNPGYVVLPNTTASLSVAVNDPELDPLTYKWTVSKFPAGANPVLATPNANNTNVSGLTQEGTYVFKINVSDGKNNTFKEVYLIVYSTNPPPILGSAGFRIVAPYGLVFDYPGITTHANIELPTSSVTLQAGIGDLANSDFTGRGTWTLIQQPAGANIMLGNTIYIFISLRAMVSNMTVPGDYIFQLNVTNPGHPDLITKVICTVHPSSSPPLISSITASPAMMNLPLSTTLLTAVTTDPESDLLRHWWAIKSVPIGTFPQFDHQCLPVTTVSGLTMPGKYIFTLRCFDDLHMTTKDVTIMVNDAVGTKNNSTDISEFILYPNPVTEELNLRIPLDFGNQTKLTICNYFGEIILEKRISENDTHSINLNLECLIPGIYSIELKSKTNSIHRQFIKI